MFELAGRRFGLPASDVQELVRIVTITPLPPGAGPVEGVIDLRGGIVPVYDLRAGLGLPPRAVDVRESLVIVRRDGRAVAIRVDRPLELARVSAGEFEPTSGFAGASAPLSPGVARLPGGLAVLLDPAPWLKFAASVRPDPAAGGSP